jgi:hypothetical protein
MKLITEEKESLDSKEKIEEIANTSIDVIHKTVDKISETGDSLKNQAEDSLKKVK